MHFTLTAKSITYANFEKSRTLDTKKTQSLSIDLFSCQIRYKISYLKKRTLKNKDYKTKARIDTI